MGKSLIPAFSLNRIFDNINDLADARTKETIEVFSYVGTQFVNDMRTNGEYDDHSGNLRSSTGYIVLVDGDIVKRFVKTANKDDGGDGKKVANDLIERLRAEFREGIMLVVFAGMEYAAAVEAHGKDVLTGSSERAGALLKELLSEGQ